MAVQSQTIPAHGEQPAAKPKAVSKADKHIWGIFIALCIISTIELYSASSREVAGSSIGVMGPILRHIVMLAGGTFVVWFLSRRHYSDFIPFTLGFAPLVSVAMMVYVMFFGEIVNGARRSLTILGIGIYPAEMVKLSAVLLHSPCDDLESKHKEGGRYLQRREIFRSHSAAAERTADKAGPDQHSAASGHQLLDDDSGRREILPPLCADHRLHGLGGLFVAYLMWSDSRSSEIPADAEQKIELVSADGTADKSPSRIDTWLARLERHKDKSTPKWEIPAVGKNRQEILSYMAQAHGGIHGVGPGNSRETSRLPLAFSDYIFAIIVEELGLIGGLVVLLLYLWLLGRASGIASHCNRTYPALVVIGMAVMIAFQALFHIAIVTGVFPVSGQPLPLLSKGGTSILVTAIAFGIMLSISRTATRQGGKSRISAMKSRPCPNSSAPKTRCSSDLPQNHSQNALTLNHSPHIFICAS